MQIFLANPRGFCAGVDRAIEVVECALSVFGAPIYVRHEVVHNRYVVKDLGARGAVFVNELSEVPGGETIIFSAHGVPQAVKREARERGLRVLDATCPLVTKVHMEVIRHARAGRECILIGHAGHPEVEGTLGQYYSDSGGIYLIESVDDVARLEVKNADDLAFVTQTTLSVNDCREIIEALLDRFPKIRAPRKDDICYATQNRQDAVTQLAQQCEVVLVVGSTTSSNSNRLREVAERLGIPAYLIDGPEDIDRAWLAQKQRVGVTAGASAPEVLVRQVIARLREWGAKSPQELVGKPEKVAFSLPRGLRAATRE